MMQANKQTGMVAAIRGCVSWQDIQAKWRTLPEKQKGDLFEELVKAYFQLEPEYASKLKHVWLQREIPQAVGRALRPAPGKQFGYVIVPILHDADATADDIFKSPAFREILTTLRALAANDDRIIEYFRGVSQGQQRKGGGSVQFEIDERLAKRIDLDDFAREIQLKCWDKLAKLSWRPFEEAREFVRGLGLSGNAEWRIFRKGMLPGIRPCPEDIPTAPEQVYLGQGWVGYGDWLGTDTIATFRRKYRPYESASRFVRSLGLANGKEWKTYCKGKLPRKGLLPSDIPAAPHNVYANVG